MYSKLITMNIPKAYVHTKAMYAIAPTEEQLNQYCKENGFDSIQDCLNHFQGMWEPFLLEWFYSVNKTPWRQEFEKNIYRVNSNFDEEIVDIMDDEEWADLKGESSLS